MTSIAKLIDHTLLKPESTRADVARLIEEAVELGTFSICVSPSLLPVRIPEGSGVKLAVVAGFPSGAHTVAVKAAEAERAVAQGADEVDMVVNLALVKQGEFEEVEAEIAAVRSVIPAPRVLKVILETAALTDAEIVAASQAAARAGADFVKTSTGFHPAGGASVHAVRLMREAVGDALGVKASGGIRTLADATAMIEAGATRLGLSASKAILAEEAGESAPARDAAAERSADDAQGGY